MKTTITETTFKDAFTKANRGDNFSYEGLSALFDYFEQIEQDCGIDIELDVIAICCEYSEYANTVDCMHDRGFSCCIDADNGEETDEQCLEYLRENTNVIEFEGGIIIQDF
jgi:hypothetical protein